MNAIHARSQLRYWPTQVRHSWYPGHGRRSKSHVENARRLVVRNLLIDYSVRVASPASSQEQQWIDHDSDS